MAAAEHCPECGSPLMAGSQEGMCARCLLAAALRHPVAGEPAGLPSPGEWIGSYRILRLLGEGGMGIVYLAGQERPMARQVALKIIKLGMDTREVVARFESERQALALMDHPAIAKVFDAGSTPQGRPYFVMEYVGGTAITDYCEQHKLTLRQRLELFREVCDGVQHAHQKAILHRDLKPSNILVCEVNGRPAPRIIDFGVAKATTQRLTADTLFTRAGAMVGTPGYMSPEQAGSAGAEVDTRTDVYSLGVVLYQLLVGVLPLDFSQTPPDQFQRRLREEEAPRPSVKLRTLGGQSGATVPNPGSDLRPWARQLRGDLDAITLKALEKEPSRRYASPSDLAADIGRYLRREPVLAHPASAGYRARKYIRRHRIGVGLAAAAVLLLLSFGMAQTLQLRRTRNERDRANRERDRANRVAGFMTNMFKVSDPSEARAIASKAREILDKASQEIDTGLARDPELQAQMMQTMGDVYDNLGLYAQEMSLLTRAVDIRRRVLGPQNPDTLASMTGLGRNLTIQGRYTEAEKLLRETLDLQRRVLGPDHTNTLKSMNILANVLSQLGRNSEAEQLQRETLGIRRRLFGPEHPGTLASMHNLGIVLFDEGRYAEAEKLDRETLEIRRRVFGPEHPATLTDMNSLAIVLVREGLFAEAEKLDRETLEIRRRILGPEHPLTLSSMGNLADVLNSEGHLAEAEKLMRKTLDTQRRVLGPEGPDTALSTYNIASVLAREGKRDEALSLLREAVDHGLRPVLDLAIEKDPNLQSLLGDRRFAALVAHAKERAAMPR